MLKEEVTIGMTVEFGRANGEKTLGTVVKKNPAKAKVKTLEGRGSRSPEGAVWGVPYSMMRAVDNPKLPLKNAAQKNEEYRKAYSTPKVPSALFANPEDYQILLAIQACYDELEPETLTKDGEASKAYVITRKGELGRKLKALFMAYGSTVEEGQVIDLIGHSNRRN